MQIQGIARVGNPSVLGVSWLSPQVLQGILVQVASTLDFTENVRTFLLPNVSGCTLDVGTGNWYVRAGSLVGDVVQGTIRWSTGMYGPWSVVSTKLPVSAPSSTFTILHTASIPEGLRIHTDNLDHTMALWEVSDQPTFPAAKTTWSYRLMTGELYVKHLPATRTYVRLHRLGVPVQMFDKPLNLVDVPLLGTEYTIHTLCSGRVTNGVPMKPRPMTVSISHIHRTTITHQPPHVVQCGETHLGVSHCRTLVGVQGVTGPDVG